ncbi:hypothetical protein [Aliivibrio logei]|uniref:hypothetical protein n=1 Tax=Aliivibrio logei TaxID=688 RepID=UPI0035C8AEE0
MVIHLYRGDSTLSNRLQSQIALDDGIIIDNVRYLSIVSIYHIIRKYSNSTLIVHQQSNLLNLLFICLLNFVFQRNINIIYDIHDLIELKSKGYKARVALFLSFIFESIVFRLNIKFLTVSSGLSRVLYCKYKRSVSVYYSMPNPKHITYQEDDKKEETIVYFGIINETRLSIEVIEKICNAGIKLDIYGYFSRESIEYQLEIKKLIDRGVIQLKGKYKPDNIGNIVSKYPVSLMLFESNSINIRYCLPNKLFQSISSGVPCVILDNLFEVNLKFKKTGGVVLLDDFLTKRIKKVNIDIDIMGNMFKKNKFEYINVLRKG